MNPDLSELIPILALLEAENRLSEFDTAEFPETGVLRWLFGLNAAFHFAKDAQFDRHDAMLDLAERYYDRTDGRCNYIRAGRGAGLKSRADIRRFMSTGRVGEDYRDPKKSVGFYIKYDHPAEIRSGDPVHDWFTNLVPGGRSMNGNLTYYTRLALLRDEPQTIIADFIESCELLKIFYAVQGFALLPGSVASQSLRHAYPIYRRFPGVMFSDPVGFSLEIGARSDVIVDVNWLTAISDTMLAKIGGIDTARATLSDAITLHPYDGGIVFQAGPTPRIGDANKGQIPAGYREVNEFLRPLRFDGWEMPYLQTPEGVNGMQATEDWIRRFDE